MLYPCSKDSPLLGQDQFSLKYLENMLVRFPLHEGFHSTFTTLKTKDTGHDTAPADTHFSIGPHLQILLQGLVNEGFDFVAMSFREQRHCLSIQ